MNTLYIFHIKREIRKKQTHGVSHWNLQVLNTSLGFSGFRLFHGQVIDWNLKLSSLTAKMPKCQEFKLLCNSPGPADMGSCAANAVLCTYTQVRSMCIRFMTWLRNLEGSPNISLFDVLCKENLTYLWNWSFM